MQQESLSAIALTRLPALSTTVLRELYTRLGSAKAIIEAGKNIKDVLPEASPRLVEAFCNMGENMRRAEEEMAWAEDKKVEVITLNHKEYPTRLAECTDAPTVVYYKGTTDLNALKVISIVGTRHCTPYGNDVIRNFLHDLQQLCPQVLVVSGLAYGVDICAHREALNCGFPTVGVLAHGLDMIYPTAHRHTAIEMINCGGLLTEYTSNSIVTKGNFVQRNRIVAGMADASILIESAAKGGGLITMNIARDYNRECFAFPGPVTAEYSRGCNNLIRDNRASLITSAEDFVKAMNWTDDVSLQKARREGIERELFPDLNGNEKAVVKQLQNANDQQINTLSVNTGLAVKDLLTCLFTLEMKGLIRPLAGGSYHLLA